MTEAVLRRWGLLGRVAEEVTKCDRSDPAPHTAEQMTTSGKQFVFEKGVQGHMKVSSRLRSTLATTVQAARSASFSGVSM